MSQHFSIVITGYNSIDFVRRCMDSALSQNHDNYNVYCVDAQTYDGTYDVLLEYAKEYDNLTVLRNNAERKYQLQNIYETVRNYVPDGSIVVSLDLDDWLPHDFVLETLESYYSPDIWMTYGTYCEHPYRDVRSHYHEYPEEVIRSNTFRQYRWLGSHLRTWRKELMMKIPVPKMVDPRTGKFYDKAGDQAFMLPMLEMAGFHSKYIPEILYVYNKTNPLSEDKIMAQQQMEVSNYIRSLPPFEKLESLC